MERYKAGYTGIEFHVWIRANRPDVDLEYFVASAWKTRIAVQLNAYDLSRRRVCSLLRQAVSAVLWRGLTNQASIHDVKNGNDNAMLVYVGERGQSTEGVQDGPLGGVVERLERFDLVGVASGDARQKSVLSPQSSVSPEYGVAENGKLDLLNLFLSRLPPKMPFGELPPSVIESAAEVMNCIAYDESPILVDLREALNASDERLHFGVIFPPDGDSHRVTFRAFKDTGAKPIYMGVRTFELVPCTN